MSEMRCHTCWGSHSCDKPAGHDGPHQCGGDDETAHWESSGFPCSRYDEATNTVQSGLSENDAETFTGWSEPWLLADTRQE